MPQDYRYSLVAKVCLEDAFTKVARVADWWNKKSTGNTQEVGDTFKVDWGQTWVDFKVTEAIPNKRLVWNVEDCQLHWLKNKTEWKGTQIIWDFASANGATEVRMTHCGLTPDVECFGACEAGWNFHVGKSLLSLLTADHGLPDHGKSS